MLKIDDLVLSVNSIKQNFVNKNKKKFTFLLDKLMRVCYINNIRKIKEVKLD